MTGIHTSVIRSIGIDIGTTTTQFVLSRLTVKNVAPGTLVPRLEITDKEVTHRSRIYFTPISDDNRIDADRIMALLRQEYQAAGVTPAEIDTGAVIITGETAKKENARAISNRIAGLAGDFVVASAGGKLEAVIAGKGSGAADYSRNHACTVANIDIGGGTANIAVFRQGNAIDSCCVNIGGRLLQLDPDSGRITQISEPMSAILASMGVGLAVGRTPDLRELEAVCAVMAETVGACLESPTPLARRLLMTEPLRLDYPLDVVMVSGGVADYVYGDPHRLDPREVRRHGDIGPLLGRLVHQWFTNRGYTLIRPTETIRATVIGAGARTVDVSGSTIMVDDALLPLRNVPVAIPFAGGETAAGEAAVCAAVSRSVKSFFTDRDLEPLAIGIPGNGFRSFKDVQALARGLWLGLASVTGAGFPLIVVLEADLAKALGQSLRTLDQKSAVICVDQLQVKEGDYIDIGRSMAGGTVVPVVIKSLVFETRQD